MDNAAKTTIRPAADNSFAVTLPCGGKFRIAPFACGRYNDTRWLLTVEGVAAGSHYYDQNEAYAAGLLHFETVPAPLGAEYRAQLAEANGDSRIAAKLIRKALKARTGRAWSVTCGRGTVATWITIHSPKARRTARGAMAEADRATLGAIMGHGRTTYHGGESVSPEARKAVLALIVGAAPALRVVG